jgi:transcriptional regulator GlxA family with amidase domain
VQKRRVAIYVFDEAEVLDFAGPFEVFSVTGRRSGEDPFDVYLVAEHGGPIRARNGFVVVPPYTFANCPPPDILLIPGGYGTRREMHRREPIEWITQVAKDAELVLSVCSGALLLAKAGMLAGLRATTHHGAAALLQETEPNCTVSMTDRVVDNGRVVLSAGISAGIDMALHMVARLHGEDVARETATYMEYDWAGVSHSLGSTR